MPSRVHLIANGDLRLSANQKCWPAQLAAEAAVIKAIEAQGKTVVRAHGVDPEKGHGFIDSQKYGNQVFKNIPPDSPLVVVEAVWQYSHHLLPGLFTHRGPILTVANWSGEWPGLVGLLNLNGSLTKAGIKFSSLWSLDFTDEEFLKGLQLWLSGVQVKHDRSHVRALSGLKLPADAISTGRTMAQELRRNKAIMGVFDEGCMGMYNAIIPDELLHSTGVFKERLSQSTLYAAMREVPEPEVEAAREWLDKKGMKFLTGPNPETDLTDNQIAMQLRMYIATLRLADEFGCDLVGIQYQQGLKDLSPASDLVEGLLNNVDRPPVKSADGTRILQEGNALPHFNEVDECAGLDALITNRIWRKYGWEPETTLHDVRWGEEFEVEGKKEFVWVLMISGAAPPQHFVGGYAGTVSERQPAMYFRLGGGTVKGISKPGEIVWSRVYVEDGKLKVDLGLAKAVSLPEAETERRLRATTYQWPIMHCVLHGVNRDQLMAQHKSNHIQVVYAPDAAAAKLGLATKAAMFAEMGLEVNVCGTETGL
jgi:hypothetical protein